MFLIDPWRLKRIAISVHLPVPDYSYIGYFLIDEGPEKTSSSVKGKIGA
jgi:hypothetical protein